MSSCRSSRTASPPIRARTRTARSWSGSRLGSRTLTFTGAAGIGGSQAPWTGTVSEFANQVVGTQATNAISAQNLDSGQKVVLNALQSRFSEQSGVNID